MNRVRLEGEVVRDAALAAGGLLDLAMGGPGVVPAAAGGWTEDERRKPEEHQGRPPSSVLRPPSSRVSRRTIYLFVRRNVRATLLEAFDAPDTNLSCPRREVTNTAPQALVMLNSPEMNAAARALAERVAREAGPAADRQVERAYRLTLVRWPAPRERRLAAAFLQRQTALLKDHARGDRDALADFCLALLNTNEFVYVD
jgi:hypothetical protein